MKNKSTSPIASIFGLIAAGAFAWYFFGGGFEGDVAGFEEQVYAETSKEFIEQYYITLRNGSQIDICVRAGLVAESYLQARDEVNYNRWKDREKNDCRAAGLNK